MHVIFQFNITSFRPLSHFIILLDFFHLSVTLFFKYLNYLHKKRKLNMPCVILMKTKKKNTK